MQSPHAGAVMRSTVRFVAARRLAVLMLSPLLLLPATGRSQAPDAAWAIVVEDDAGHRKELALSARDGPWSWPLGERSWGRFLGRLALGVIAILALFLGARSLWRRPRHAS